MSSAAASATTATEGARSDAAAEPSSPSFGFTNGAGEVTAAGSPVPVMLSGAGVCVCVPVCVCVCEPASKNPQRDAGNSGGGGAPLAVADGAGGNVVPEVVKFSACAGLATRQLGCTVDGRRRTRMSRCTAPGRSPGRSCEARFSVAVVQGAAATHQSAVPLLCGHRN